MAEMRYSKWHSMNKFKLLLLSNTPSLSLPLLEALPSCTTLCSSLHSSKFNRNHAYKPSQLSVLAPEHDIAIVISYGQLIPSSILALFKLGSINMHPSLLPKYRGSSPILHTVLNGDTLTGVSVITLSKEFDKGMILHQTSRSIVPFTRYADLESCLALDGRNAVMHVLDNWQECTRNARPQQGKISYAKKVGLNESIIDFRNNSDCVYRHFLAYSGVKSKPWFSYKNNRVIVLEACMDLNQMDLAPGLVKGNRIQCGDGNGFLIKRVLVADKPKSVEWKDFVNGYGLQDGDLLGR